MTIGQPFTFTAVVTGTAPITCQWYEQGVTISGATSCSSYSGTASIGQGGHSFHLAASNAAGGPIPSSDAILTLIQAAAAACRVCGNLGVSGNQPIR